MSALFKASQSLYLDSTKLSLGLEDSSVPSYVSLDRITGLERTLNIQYCSTIEASILSHFYYQLPW